MRVRPPSQLLYVAAERRAQQPPSRPDFLDRSFSTSRRRARSWPTSRRNLPAMQDDVAERPMKGRLGRRDRREVL